jgi:hypothetical protein
VNAVDTSDNKVIPLVLPVTAAKPLVAMYEKYGTLTDRDYELVREGEGLETEYRALPESPQKMRLSKFERLDLIEFLEAQIGGDDDEDDEPRAKPKSKAAPARNGQAIKRRRQVDDEDDDLADVDDDDPPFKSNVKRGGGRIVKSTKTTGRSTSSSKTKAGPARRPMRRS